MQEFIELKGAKVLRAKRSTNKHNDDQIIFETNRGTWVMYHYRDCCESVYIEDINGDLDDLSGATILSIEERTQDESQGYGEIMMWTFYDIRTTHGDVTIRWNGSSNGYYSVSVNFEPKGSK